jgi:hypothetical protein
VSALSGAIAATAIVLGADGETVGILAGVWSAVVGACILIIANQPPTVNSGDTVNVVTPADQPNKAITV